ncbi:uncharacterized protein TNCV_3045951 [Trichonephila clavipes]|uniref:Uncharacterized protein n=1 Tax=Trichonephila clavipes TaxID=2585209 RepID=A0A8X6V0S7_TRICX|nr:uncharacterized protein TNCV_3045951 [Trichonephila clavipes]
MGKVADLSDFDRGQIVMARRLGTDISETARLAGCSLSTIVSTYAKWLNDGEASSRRHGVGRPHVIKEKGRRRLPCMAEWWYYALGDVLLADTGTRGCGKADNECYRVSENDCGPVAPLHGICSSSWTTHRVKSLKLCWSGSRNMMLNSVNVLAT